MATKGEESAEDDFPTELRDRLSEFDEALNDIEKTLGPLHTVALNQRHEELSLVDKAKLDLLGVYAINSLFWGYLRTKGQDPKEHGIKSELDRIRNYMSRVKEVEDKINNPPKRINVDTAKRFMRSALWQKAQAKSAQADKGQTSTESTDQSTDQPVATASSEAKGKHARFPDQDAPATKKRKEHHKKKKHR